MTASSPAIDSNASTFTKPRIRKFGDVSRLTRFVPEETNGQQTRGRRYDAI
jgi:hypothetical protein